MELNKFLEDKRAEIENLGAKLTKLRGELIEEKFPPRWSGDVRELSKFVTDLEEWVKGPEVKRSKELIEKLKKHANDSRSFKGLGEDYLITILESLESASSVISKIDNKSLKANASTKVLDKLQAEQDFTDLIGNIGNYWKSFKEFEKKVVRNEFLRVVKANMLASLVKHAEFSIEQITEAESTLEKASNAFELLLNSSVSIQAYVKTYETSKSVDEIWGEADNIRRLLGNTDFQIAGKFEDPFGEMSDILNRRTQCIKGKTLNEISYCLKEIEKKTEDWKRNVGEKFDDEYHKTKALTEFAKLEEGVEGLFEKFRKKIQKSFNVNDIYSSYEKLQKIKSEATKKLEGQFSENERRIIENLENADGLVKSMGEDFWVAIKTLREKQLIRIAIERGV